MGFEKLKERLAGVVSIPVTPFDAAGEIDEAALVTVLNRLVDGGIEAVTPNGNTGEFYALSEPEARRITDLTAVTVGHRAAVIAGVGNSVPHAVAAARHAEQAGADAIMIHQPVHPYLSLDGWVAYHAEIAAAVPGLGVVPYIRNPRVDGAHLAALADRAPNVIAVKYSVPDPVRFATVAREAGLHRFVWIAGLAELAAPGYWAVGAVGFTSGLANVDPALSLGMLHALRANDFPAAMRIWDKIRPFEALRAANESENNVSVVKEALAQLNICRREVRAPIATLSQPDRARIAELLAEWGLSK